MSFPLNTFIDEKPRDKGEAYVKSRPEILRNLVRNTITKGKVDSGLNTLKTENGFYNIGENVEKVHIEDGFAYVKPSCKLSMEKAGIDTSEWKSKHNQGERKNIPNGQLYYEAKIKDAYLQLPTPLNKTPNSMISNANSQIDSSCIDEVNINKGTKADLIQAEDIEIEQHYRKDDSLAAKIKNDLIRKTKAYPNALNIESDEYINMINNIPDSTIYGMINYNNQTNKPATSLLDEGWSKSLSNIASTTSVPKLMNYMFNSISNVTGQPNNVSSVVVEKHLVPNLKGVKTTEINRRPNNVTLDITVEPPKPGTTILSRQVTAGTPTVRTGTDSSYRLKCS
ncbi:polar tube protein [Vairimorpha apis BRL 01]|uniref:Polar tube protein n=1 Tax=Vairimorpha apis BRL 01 TaxID=1037528 RepID=T0MBD4_9MICR|nr:polar tube protein [Vairimorpha apis BRL 01]